jgi:hypothetical protein
MVASNLIFVNNTRPKPKYTPIGSYPKGYVEKYLGGLILQQHHTTNRKASINVIKKNNSAIYCINFTPQILNLD